MSVGILPAEVEFEDPRAAQILRRIQDNELIDDMGDVFPEYHAALRQTLYIAAPSEVTVLTWAYTEYETAPDLGAKIAISETIQDEIGPIGRASCRERVCRAVEMSVVADY